MVIVMMTLNVLRRVAPTLLISGLLLSASTAYATVSVSPSPTPDPTPSVSGPAAEAEGGNGNNPFRDKQRTNQVSRSVPPGYVLPDQICQGGKLNPC